MQVHPAIAPRTAKPRLAPATVRRPSRLLAELLALNEEMAVQLRLEDAGDARSAGFLIKMIAQHEKAAALLRAQLRREVAPVAHGHAAG